MNDAELIVAGIGRREPIGPIISSYAIPNAAF